MNYLEKLEQRLLLANRAATIREMDNATADYTEDIIDQSTYDKVVVKLSNDLTQINNRLSIIDFNNFETQNS